MNRWPFKLSTPAGIFCRSGQALRESAIQLDKDLKVVTVNTIFLNYFNMRGQEILEANFIDFVVQYWTENAEHLGAFAMGKRTPKDISGSKKGRNKVF